MLLKLFYTALIVGGILLVVRSRMGGRARDERQRVQEPAGVNPRWVAYGIIGFILATSVGITAYQWLSSRDMVSVRVINSNTGQTTVYAAFAEEVGERSFRAADGTVVHLANMERMEVMD